MQLPFSITVLHDLCNLDNNDGLICCYTFSWFKTCRITLDLLGETINLDDIVSKDETTQTGRSHAINEGFILQCMVGY